MYALLCMYLCGAECTTTTTLLSKSVCMCCPLGESALATAVYV